MQNLIYKRNGSEPPSKFRKIIHASLLIVLPYIHARLNKILTEHEGDENVWWLGGKSHVEVWRKLNALEMYVKLAQMINFLVFIVNGRYRNIADRIMGMRLIFARRLMLRQVSFDYMNRELVWNGFAEIIFFLFPLINFSKLRNWLHLLLFSGFNSTSAQNRKKQKLPAITNTACPICGDEAIQVPYCATSCKHVFCYFCIQSALMTEPSHTIICKLCGETITRITRVVANKS
jgi:peroxin-2